MDGRTIFKQNETEYEPSVLVSAANFFTLLFFRKAVGSVVHVNEIKATQSVLRSLVFLTDVLREI